MSTGKQASGTIEETLAAQGSFPAAAAVAAADYVVVAVAGTGSSGTED